MGVFTNYYLLVLMVIFQGLWLQALAKVPNDPHYEQQWGFQKYANMEQAWDLTTGSKDVVVAIIDSGVDLASQDLRENLWVNSVEALGQPGVDDDGNGFIDDIHGYNFLDLNGDVQDHLGHGSHIAGIIGARGDNGVGIAGMNWNVSMMIIKVFGEVGKGTAENTAKGIHYAVDNGARIINLSQGLEVAWPGMTSQSEALAKAFQYAQDHGVLMVSAAGNSGTNLDKYPEEPASYKLSNMIVVGGVNEKDLRPSTSNFGLETVHIAAPAINILSHIVGGFGFKNGTSMAAPFVAGAAALLLAKEPHLSALELRQRLLFSTQPIRSWWGKSATGGLLDVFAALNRKSNPPDPMDPHNWNLTLEKLETPHPYLPNQIYKFQIHREGALRMALHFSMYEVESADKIYLKDPQGNVLAVIEHRPDDGFSPVIAGDTVFVEMHSDELINSRGFIIDGVATDLGTF